MHFELIFMKGVCVQNIFFFLLYMWMFVYFSTICWKIIFTPLYYLCVQAC